MPRHVTVTVEGNYTQAVTPDPDAFNQLATAELAAKSGVDADRIQNLEPTPGTDSLCMHVFEMSGFVANSSYKVCIWSVTEGANQR